MLAYLVGNMENGLQEVKLKTGGKHVSRQRQDVAAVTII